MWRRLYERVSVRLSLAGPPEDKLRRVIRAPRHGQKRPLARSSPPLPPPPPQEASPLAQGGPLGPRGEPSPRGRRRGAAMALRCPPTVADLPLRLDDPGIGAPAPSRSPPPRSPPSARSPTPRRLCQARSVTRRWRPTCQQRLTATACNDRRQDRRQTGSRCCRCRRRRCRCRPARTLPPPDRGRAARTWWGDGLLPPYSQSGQCCILSGLFI